MSRSEQIAGRIAARRLGLSLAEAERQGFEAAVAAAGHPELAADHAAQARFSRGMAEALGRVGRFYSLKASDVDARRSAHPGEAVVDLIDVYAVDVPLLLEHLLGEVGVRARIAVPPPPFSFAAAFVAANAIRGSGVLQDWPTVKLEILRVPLAKGEVIRITGATPDKWHPRLPIDLVLPRQFEDLPGHKKQVVFRSRIVVVKQY